MNNIFYRIDDRLIHGQVVTGWSRHYNLEEIIIVDDETANDPVQKQVISMVAPSDLNVSINSINEGALKINEAAKKGTSTLVLVKGPESLVGLFEHNVNVNTVIVGGMQHKADRKRVTKTVYTSDQEAKFFNELADRGSELYYQVVPNDKQQNFNKLLETVHL